MWGAFDPTPNTLPPSVYPWSVRCGTDTGEYIIYNNVQYQVVDTYFVTGIITRPTDMKKYVEVWKFWEVIAKGYVAPSTVQDGCLQNWFQQMFKEKCESTQKTSEHVWSSHTARVWTNRVELPILHMVS